MPALLSIYHRRAGEKAGRGGASEQPGRRVRSDGFDKPFRAEFAVRAAIRQEQRAIRQQLRTVTDTLESENLTRLAEDELIRLRVQRRSVHALFIETILYLLER